MRLFAAAVLILFAGCATRGGAGDTGRVEGSVGSASLYDLSEKSQRLMMAHSFQVFRQERVAPGVLIESQWRERSPFDDEADAGVERVQTRIIITGTPRSRTAMGDVYGVRMAVENRAQVMGNEGWRPLASSRAFREWANHMLAQLRTELNTGLRVF